MIWQYGWASIDLTPGDEYEHIDDEDSLLYYPIAYELRDEAKARFNHGNPVVDLIPVNGDYHLRITGKQNHRGQDHEDVLEFYRHVAREAPGSFGTLMVWDDEDKEGKHNEFVTYVMARGKVTAHKDPFLSPCMPTIEDP
ncbi:MAG: Imm7 family immunity protein [Myxococcota bacterium]